MLSCVFCCCVVDATGIVSIGTYRAGLSQSAALFQIPSPPPLPTLLLPFPSPSAPTLPRLPSLPSSSFFSPSLPPLPRHESALLKPDKRSGERCKLPCSGVRALAAVAFCCIVCSQTHLLVVGYMYVALISACLRRNLNIRVVQIGNLIDTEFLGSKIAAP